MKAERFHEFNINFMLSSRRYDGVSKHA